MLSYADATPVDEVEGADIDRVGRGVLAAPVLPLGVADDVAARVAAEALDRGDPLAKHLLGHRLHIVLEPEGERDGGLAGDLVVAGRLCRRSTGARLEPAAAVLERAVGNQLGLDVGGFSVRGTGRGA